jgi:hypothetical protein
MNILYTITWPEIDSEETPRLFYGQLRASVAHGARFPYDCPYEIALVQASTTPDATPPAAAWAVAVLANSVASETLGGTEQTVPLLEGWFRQCVPGGIPPGGLIHSGHATHLKLASELRPDYVIIENFGTFVGEPEIELPAKPLSAEAVALKALVGQPLSAEAQRALASLPSRPLATAPVNPLPAIPNTVSTCLGVGLMIAGVILIPVSLVLGALMAFGQFSSAPATAGSTTTSTTDFIFLLACCPLPILILGIGMIFLGIFLPRWLKQTQSLPVTPPKG